MPHFRGKHHSTTKRPAPGEKPRDRINLHRSVHVERRKEFVDVTRSFPAVCSFITGRSRYNNCDPALSRGKSLDLYVLPTLRRTWHGPRRPEPPCAFEMSMIREFCNSH